MVKLNVFERLVLLQILPVEGDIASLKIVRELQSKLGFTEGEFKEFELQKKDNTYVWNEKGRKEKEIMIGDKMNEIIIDSLKQLDKQKKLSFNHMNLYSKFIKEK